MPDRIVQGIWMVGVPMLVIGLIVLWVWVRAGIIKSSRTRSSIRGYLLVALVLLLPGLTFTWLVRWHADDLLASGSLEGELLRHTETMKWLCTMIVFTTTTTCALLGIACASALLAKATPLYESLVEAMAAGRRVSAEPVPNPGAQV